MVDSEGAVELSLPIIANGNFSDCVERVFLREAQVAELDDFDAGDVSDDFDIEVSRKTK